MADRCAPRYLSPRSNLVHNRFLKEVAMKAANVVVRGSGVLLAGITLFAVAASPASADPLKIEAVVSTKEQTRLDFADGSGRFVAMVRREGKATGQGLLSGTAVNEYGRHEVIPGTSGDGNGYLVFALPQGDVAHVKWQVRAVFVPGPDGKAKVLDNGVWEVVGGTGKLKGLKGAGTLNLKVLSPTDRNFILQGELTPTGESKK
jgi:hypothetical protein